MDLSVSPKDMVCPALLPLMRTPRLPVVDWTDASADLNGLVRFTERHGVSSITATDPHTSAANSQLNWRPRQFKWTRPFCRKTKSGFCVCAITFQLTSTTVCVQQLVLFVLFRWLFVVLVGLEDSNPTRTRVSKCNFTTNVYCGKPFATIFTELHRGRLCLKCDGTHAETRFRLSVKRTSTFKSAVSIQSTTGSRGVHISGSNVGYTMFRGSVKGTGYPLHLPVSPSLALPCVTMCHHVSTGLYHPVMSVIFLLLTYFDSWGSSRIRTRKDRSFIFYCTNLLFFLFWLVCAQISKWKHQLDATNVSIYFT